MTFNERFQGALSNSTFAERRFAEKKLEQLAEKAYYSDKDNPCYYPFGEHNFAWEKLSESRKELVRKYAMFKLLSNADC